MSIPLHVSPESSPADRGRMLGAAHRAAIARAAASYVELFGAKGVARPQVRDWAQEALAATRAWAPALAEEIDGVADGAGVEPWLLGALNGRTEILAAADVTGEGECSTAVTMPGGGGPPRTVQTWDWHDTLRHVMLLRRIRVAPTRWVATFTEFGIVGKIGVNDAGLGLHFNVLRHAGDHARIGVPVHVVARRILDEATTVDHARALAADARLSASSVLTVVTATEAVCLELSPAGVAVLPASDGLLCHTNHFLDRGLAAGERTMVGSTTVARLAALRRRATALRSPDRDVRTGALGAHGPDEAPLCAHADPTLPPQARWESLATVVLDVVNGRLEVHEGGPCRVRPPTWQAVAARPGRPDPG